MPATAPRPRAAPEQGTDWSLAELGRSVTNLTGAVTELTHTVGQLGQTMAQHGTRLATLERFAYSTVGALLSLGAGALLSGHLHWG